MNDKNIPTWIILQIIFQYKVRIGEAEDQKARTISYMIMGATKTSTHHWPLLTPKAIH